MTQTTRRAVIATASAAALSACSQAPSSAPVGQTQSYRFKMVTSWPANFPGLGVAASRFAEYLGRASAGQLTVKVFGAGELVPALEVFDAVAGGTAEFGHSGAYYWKGKSEALQFFGSVPFGLTPAEMNGWLYYGGGLELWRELYARFGLVPFPCGNTGLQMAGWFRREINSAADYAGLKMRIPGLGGDVISSLGAAPVNIPGGELYTALSQGAIDATEWVGPYNDLAFGLHQAAEHYYSPGWHEPGSTLELMVNKQTFDGLPEDLQMLIELAAKAVNLELEAEYSARNPQALAELESAHGVSLKVLSPEVLSALKAASEEALKAVAARSPDAQRVYDSFRAFRDQSASYLKRSLTPYLAARDA